ncbi:MAG: histidine phosphatase family protein, partial [Cyanobacteria bacterium J06626_14]
MLSPISNEVTHCDINHFENNPMLHLPSDSETTRIILVRHGRSTFNDQQRYQGSSDDAVLNTKGWYQARCVGEALQGLTIDAIYTSPLQRTTQTTQAITSVLNRIKQFAPQQNVMRRGSLREYDVENGWSTTATLSRTSTLVDGAAGFSQLETEQIPVISCDRLREIELPAWQGRPYQEVRTQEADAYRRWLTDPHEFQMMANQRNDEGVGICSTDSTRMVYPVINLYARAQNIWDDILPRYQCRTVLMVSHGGTNHALLSTALGLSPRFHHRLQQSNGGISVVDYSPSEMTAQLRSLNLTQHLGESLPKLKAGKRGLRLLLLPVASDSPHSGGELTDLEKTRIAQMLDTVPIAYSLTQAGNYAQALTQDLLRDRPDIVQLQVQHAEFSTQWHQALTRVTSTSDLSTGLVVAPVCTLQQLIAEAIGLQYNASKAIALHPGTLSVLHYPVGDHPPVLQAMNILS